MTTKALRQVAADLQLIPRRDTMDAIFADLAARGRVDAQLAPIWAEKLRHTYQKVLEVKFPEYAAANGDVLPIDTSVPPSALEWDYYMIEQTGYADWIDDDGHQMPSGSMKASRFVGRCHALGHKYRLNEFDMERAAAAAFPLANLKQQNAKRTHDAMTNWVWLFGDSGKNLPGLCNHPNITVTLAPLNAGSTSRLWEHKTNDEIAADLALLIDTIPTDTIRAYFASTVFLPFSLVKIMRNRRLGAGDGFASLWDWMQDRYKGDDTGQGKVTFKVLNECDANLRKHPKTQTDTSGISGDFLLAIPNASTEELAFIRARPFTQKPPQERDFEFHHNTHSKIGGCKCQIPLAVHRMDFGTT